MFRLRNIDPGRGCGVLMPREARADRRCGGFCAGALRAGQSFGNRVPSGEGVSCAFLRKRLSSEEGVSGTCLRKQRSSAGAAGCACLRKRCSCGRAASGAFPRKRLSVRERRGRGGVIDRISGRNRQYGRTECRLPILPRVPQGVSGANAD